MQFGSRRMRLVVTGATIAWLIGVALVSSGVGAPTHVALASASPSNTKVERALVQPARCDRPGFVGAGAQAASPQPGKRTSCGVCSFGLYW